MKLRWRKISRRTGIFLVSVALLLLAARLALPYVVQRYVNNVLNSIPDYRGSVRTVNIKLWRGAYQIQDLKLEKYTGNVPVPFFEAKTVDLMIEWRELFHGALVGQITLYEPKVNYVSAPTPEESQTGIDDSWQSKVAKLFPLRINRFTVVDGELHFRNFAAKPPVDVFLNQIKLEASNLRNSRDKGENLFATIDASGHPMKQANLRIHARLDPLAPQPTFDLNGELINVPLVQLNSFFLAYGGFQVSDGQLDAFTELAAANGNLTGYVKPILRQARVKVWSGQETNPAQFLWEPLVGLMSLAVRNWPQDQFATKVPVSGNFSDPRVHSWKAFFSLLGNAWFESVKPGVDGTVNLQTATAANDAEKKDSETASPSAAPSQTGPVVHR